MSRWLEDLVVVDLGDEATAAGSGLLAELGATVVRLEWEDDGLRGQPWMHRTANAGKLSLLMPADPSATSSGQSVEGQSVEGQSAGALLDRLAAVAGRIDVAIGPMDPTHPGRGALHRLGQAGVPTVEVVFRREAPEAAATDLIVAAASGQLVLNGGPDDPPAHPAGDLGYKQVSLAAGEAALALALSRRRTGRVSNVVVSAQEAMALTTVQTANGNFWHWHHKAPGRNPKLTDGTTVKSADGKWTSFTIHAPNWPRFVEWVGAVLGPQGIEGPEWDDSEHAVRNRHVIVGVTARLAGALTQAELLAEGQARGLLLLPVQDLGAVASDRHLAARDFWEAVDGDHDDPAVRIAGSPFRSSHGRDARGSAPKPGQGGLAFLADLEQSTASEKAGREVGPLVRDSASGPVPEPVLAAAPDLDPRLPLTGVRVLDFCWAIAGPLTTRLLAGLGAEVLKVESENGLDTIRYIGVQPPGEASWDTNGVFQDTSPNKKSVTINVDTEAGQEVVKQLVATADVVTANYTPDRMARWGLGPEELEAIKPDVITMNMAVMGTTGPNTAWRSYGSGIVAMCGLAAHTGPEGRLPECLGTLHTDFTVPYFAALQIMAALHQRDRTGRGAHLELAQYETAVRLLDSELASVLNGGETPPRTGNRSTRFSPHGVFPALGEDRWLALSCRGDDDWRRLGLVIPELAALDRIEDQDEVEARLTAWSRTLINHQAATQLQADGIPASAVEDLSDLFSWDTAMAQAWTEIEMIGGTGAVVLQEPVTWNGNRLPLRRSPGWFEHTYEIVCEELGMDQEAFANLVEARSLW